MEKSQNTRLTPPGGSITRGQDAGSGSWLWRACVTRQGRRVDRCFQDNTYGGSGFAETMAGAWREAMVTAFLEAAGVAALKERIAAVNARFDALRPRMVCVSVYILSLDGEPCQLRALVSDRGQTLQRKELTANYRVVSMRAALSSLREKIRLQIEAFFGAEVATGFMEKHGRKFIISRLDKCGRLELRERADQFQQQAMTSD